MYVPYGVAIKDTKGNVQQQGISQDYCQNSLKHTDNLGTLTICDAPGGMARIFNAGTIKAYECLSSTPLKQLVADIASPLFQRPKPHANYPARMGQPLLRSPQRALQHHKCDQRFSRILASR